MKSYAGSVPGIAETAISRGSLPYAKAILAALPRPICTDPAHAELREALKDAIVWLEAEATYPRENPHPAMLRLAGDLSRALLKGQDGPTTAAGKEMVKDHEAGLTARPIYPMAQRILDIEREARAEAVKPWRTSVEKLVDHLWAVEDEDVDNCVAEARALLKGQDE